MLNELLGTWQFRVLADHYFQIYTSNVESNSNFVSNGYYQPIELRRACDKLLVNHVVPAVEPMSLLEIDCNRLTKFVVGQTYSKVF